MRGLRRWAWAFVCLSLCPIWAQAPAPVRAIYPRVQRAEGWTPPPHGKKPLGYKPFDVAGLSAAGISPSRIVARQWPPAAGEIQLPAYYFAAGVLRLETMRARVDGMQELLVDGRVFAVRCQTTTLESRDQIQVMWIDRAGDGRFREIAVGVSSSLSLDDLPDWVRKQLSAPPPGRR